MTKLLLAIGVIVLVQSVTGQRPNTYPPLPLTVQVMASDTYANDTGVLPDGVGDKYTDGIQGVCASFDQYGNLIINFDCSRTSTPRNLRFKMNRPFIATNCNNGVYPVPPDPQTTGIAYSDYLSTSAPGDYPVQNSYTPLQNMQPGMSQCVELSMSYTFQNRAGTQYRLAYHRAGSSPNFPQMPYTPYAVVTKAVDGSSWTVEPDSQAACNAGKYPNAPNVATTPTQGPFNFQDCGTYTVPFRFVLTPKQ